ncbi:MAG: hypothetical protein ACRD3T_20210 [Terriglobia bacterium]
MCQAKKLSGAFAGGDDIAVHVVALAGVLAQATKDNGTRVATTSPFMSSPLQVRLRRARRITARRVAQTLGSDVCEHSAT